MHWRVSAWTHPQDPDGFAPREHSVPFVALNAVYPEEPRGRITLTVAADYPWQDLIKAQNPTDPADTSLLRIYAEGVDNTGDPDAEYKLNRFSRRITDDGEAVVDLYGVDWRQAALDAAVLRWYDWQDGAERTVDADWIYGETNNLLRNADAESTPMPNGGLEDGNTDHWQTTQADGTLFADATIQAVNSAVDAHTGEWYAIVNPAAAGGGARRSIPGFVPGKTYTITGRIRETTASGDRLRAGIIGASTASHTNAYLENEYWWAEIGNAAQGAGAADGTWQAVTLTFVAAQDNIELVVVYQDINNLDFHIDSWTVSGQQVGIDPWIGFANGRAAGTVLNVAEYSTAQSFEGAASIHIQGVDGPYTDGFGRIGYGTFGITQDVALTVGKTYTFTTMAFHDGTGTNGATERIRLVVNRKTPRGALRETLSGAQAPGPGSYYMANTDALVAANTWTRISMTFVADVEQVAIQIRYAGTNARTNVGTFTSPHIYLDKIACYAGLAAATAGVIANDVLDDAQSDHPTLPRLPYIGARTWTATLDSAGVAWPRDEHIILRPGRAYGSQLFGQSLWDLGKVYDLTPNGATPTWDMHLWEAANRGTTHTDIGFVVGLGAAGGLVAGRLPKATRYLLQGAGGIIAEVANTAQEAATGIEEAWVGDTDIGDRPTLLAKGAHLLNDDLANRVAINVDLDDTAPRPWDAFTVGDRAPFLVAGLTDQHERRISEITLRATTTDGETNWQPSVTASRILRGAAAEREAMHRYLTEYRRLFPEPEPPLALTGGEGGGGAPTIVVAAADATEYSKANAHFVCTGSNDHLVIQLALEQLRQTGGRVLLTEGTFNISTNKLHLNEDTGLDETITLEGVGTLATRIFTSDTTGCMIAVGHFSAVRNLYLQGNTGGAITPVGIGGTQFDIGIGAGGNNVHIDSVAFQFIDTAIRLSGNRWTISHCESFTAVDWFVQDNDLYVDTRVSDNLILGGNLDMGNGTGWVVADNKLSASVLADGATDFTISGNTWSGDASVFNNALIELANAARFTITGNEADSIGFDGIRLTTCTDGTITGNSLLQADIAVHALTNSARIAITGNNLGAFTAAVKIDTSSDITITGNLARFAGLLLTTASRVVSTGNEWLDADQHGIQITSSDDCTVRGDLIYRPGRSLTNTFDGILVEGDSDRVDLAGNRIIGDPGAVQPRWAINVAAATCNDCSYLGNRTGTAADYGTGTYNNAGTGTINTWPGAAAPQGDNLL